MIKIIKYFFEAFFVYSFFIVAKITGLALGRRISSFVFKNIGPFIKSNDIVKKNLAKYSKNLSKRREQEIILNMWSNYGMTFVEYIFLKRFRNESLHISIENEQILNDVISNNKQVIFISGHFANFELMSMEITKKKINLATIYRPLNNFFLNKFMEYLRKKYVCKNQIKKGRSGVKETLEYINKGHSIALMIDQRVSEGEKIKFFNEDALTTTLPAQLSVKYNIDILPIFIERKNNEFFNIKIFKPIQPKKFQNKIEITNKLNEVLEKMVIKNPDQWIWTHDRWK